MFNKVELLAPAGDYVAFVAALSAGADAVYIGGKCFGARSFANNFTEEEMIKAVNLAHLYLKKVYVAVNTLIFDDEVKELKKYLAFLQSIHVDAVIVQDLGIVKIINDDFPNLPIHASTQMNIFNQQGIDNLKRLGVERIVLARETSLDDINKFDLGQMEIEVFIHGALCFCSSGNCYMSSVIGGRSGNRGKCAQPCRQVYSLLEDNKVVVNNKPLISMKDLLTIDYISEIVNSGVNSLKIEGRMKKASYVYTVTSIYREKIDEFYMNKKIHVSDFDINQLKLAFNRQFTKGYLFNENNCNVVNTQGVNHQGLNIGTVIDSKNGFVSIKLTDNLHVQDAIRFKDINEGLLLSTMLANNQRVKSAQANGIVQIIYPKNIKKGTLVLKTSSYMMENERMDDFEKSFLKTKVDMSLYLLNDETLVLKYCTSSNEIGLIEKSNEIVNNSIEPLTIQRIKEQLAKLGGTPYVLGNLEVDENKKYYVKIKDINLLRRSMVEELNKNRLNKDIIVKRSKLTFNSFPIIKEEPTIECVVSTKEQYEACKQLNVKNVYASFNDNNKLVGRLNYTEVKNSSLVHNIGQIYNYSNVLSCYFNITNRETIKAYRFLGATTMYLSTELDENRIKSIIENNKDANLGIVAYGKIDLMVSKHCIVGKYAGASNKHCLSCLKHKYQLVDRFGNKQQLILEPENDCTMRILNYNTINLINNVYKLKELGLGRFLLIFTDESASDVSKIITLFSDNLISIKHRVDNCYLGSFKKPIE